MIMARYDVILDQSVRVLLYNHLSNYTKYTCDELKGYSHLKGLSGDCGLSVIKPQYECNSNFQFYFSVSKA